MKKILLITCFLISLFIVNARSVYNPYMRYNSTDGQSCEIKICGVDIMKDSTVVRLKIDFTPKYWIRMAKNTVLKTDRETYRAIGAHGIKLGETFWMPKTGIAEVEIIFPPIPENTRKISIIESDEWQFLDIDLTGENGPEQYFGRFGNDTHFDYTYMSPLMLKSMKGTNVLNFPAEKLKRVEIVKTQIGGRDNLWNTVESVVASNNMQLVSQNNKEKDHSQFFLYISKNDKSKSIDKLLMVTKTGVGACAGQIVYVEGEIGDDDLLNIVSNYK